MKAMWMSRGYLCDEIKNEYLINNFTMKKFFKQLCRHDYPKQHYYTNFAEDSDICSFLNIFTHFVFLCFFLLLR